MEFEDKHTKFLIQAKNGDSEAFNKLHQGLEKIVRDFTISLNGSLDSADRADIVQEVFLRAWQKLPQYREECSAKTYIFSIAKNVVREKSNRKVRLKLLAPEDISILAEKLWQLDIEEHFGDHDPELAHLIERGKMKLSKLQREAFELKHLHGLPLKDLADMAGCSYDQFQDRFFRARRNLREFLEDVLEPPP